MSPQARQLAVQRDADDLANASYPVGPDGRLAAKPDPDAADDTKPMPPAPDAGKTAEKVKVGDFELSPDDVAALMQQKAENDLRATRIPATPEGYKLEIPADLKLPLPDGAKFQFDATNPILKDAQAFALKAGLDQNQFSTVLGLYAQHEAQQTAKFAAAQSAEIAKLGNNANSRVAAVTTFIRGHLGDKIAGPMLLTLATAAQVEGWEKIMTRMQNGGAASFSQQHRDLGDRNRVSQEVYDRMSYGQKKAYANRFSQS
jgi:hypothetical protein